MNEKTQVAELLIQANASLNLRDNWNKTALYYGL